MRTFCSTGAGPRARRPLGRRHLRSAQSDATPPRPAAQVRAAVDKRVGLIEIDLADGTRLRVDAFANERALQRVLTVLKARS